MACVPQVVDSDILQVFGIVRYWLDLQAQGPSRRLDARGFTCYLEVIPTSSAASRERQRCQNGVQDIAIPIYACRMRYIISLTSLFGIAWYAAESSPLLPRLVDVL